MEIFQGDLVRKEEFADAFQSSPVRCMECDSYITSEQEDYIFRSRFIEDDACHMCGMDLFEESVVTDIHPDSEYLLDIQNAKDEVWYHATDREDWMGDLLEDKNPEDDSVPLVHIGTLAAASYIMAQKYACFTETIYLYRVRLSPDAVIDVDLYEDENLWPERTNDIGCFADAFRYVNRWESTGSISMLVDPEHLIVEKVTALSQEEMRAEVAKFPRIRLSKVP